MFQNNLKLFKIIKKNSKMNSTREVSNNTNTNTNTYNLAVLVIDTFLAIEIVALNSIVTIIILFYMNKQKLSNIIFLLISLVDLSVGLFCLPGNIVLNYNKYWKFGQFLCIAYKSTDYATSILSLFLLLMITIHRFLQLKNPFKHREEMNRYRWIIVGVVCVLSYLNMIIICKVYFDNEEDKFTCHFKTFKLYVFLYILLSMTIPFVLILLMNALMIWLFIKKKKSNKTLGERRNKKEENAIYCVLSITANLIFCWLPYNILYLIRKNNSDYLEDALFLFTYACVYLFSGLNPIILLYFNTNYRTVLFEKLRALFGLIKCK